MNHIYKGDCIKVMDRFPPGLFGIVFADPPYNLSGKNFTLINNKTGGSYYKMNEKWDSMSEQKYQEFSNIWVSQACDLLNQHGSIYVCSTYHNIADVIYSLRRSKMHIKNIITWRKTNAMPNITKRMFTHSTEFIVYATKNPKWVFNYDKLKEINPERQKNGNTKQMRDVWDIPLVQGNERLKSGDGRAFHPTQKPEEVVKRALVASSAPGEPVLDPFIGSGTTAVVAEALCIDWVGIERDADYCKRALQRIRAHRHKRVGHIV